MLCFCLFCLVCLVKVCGVLCVFMTFYCVFTWCLFLFGNVVFCVCVVV